MERSKRSWRVITVGWEGRICTKFFLSRLCPSSVSTLAVNWTENRENHIRLCISLRLWKIFPSLLRCCFGIHQGGVLLCLNQISGVQLRGTQILPCQTPLFYKWRTKIWRSPMAGVPSLTICSLSVWMSLSCLLGPSPHEILSVQGFVWVWVPHSRYFSKFPSWWPPENCFLEIIIESKGLFPE